MSPSVCRVLEILRAHRIQPSGAAPRGAAPFRAPAAAQGERSKAASPWTPAGHPRGSRCAPFRQPGATHGAPTAVESAHNARPSQGDGSGPSPCHPLGRRLRRRIPLPVLGRPPPTARAGRGRAPGRPPDRARSVAAGAAPRQGPARNLAQTPARGAAVGGGCRADP